MILLSDLPVLDECDQVYIAGGGPAGECLRLNPAASRLWRSTVGTLREDGLAALPETSRSFLEQLLQRGVLRWQAR